MEVVYIDWTPIYKKIDIFGGGDIRRYYSWTTLNNMVDRVIPFKKKNRDTNREAVFNIFRKNSIIWVEYPCDGFGHLIVLLACIVRKKKVIINVHDFLIQRKYVYREPNYLKNIKLRIIEKLLLRYANFIILPCPGLLDYINPKKNQKIIIMPPGVGEDELFIPSFKNNNLRKIALYFGSMQRKGSIPKIIDIFSELKEWELHLVGRKEGQEIIEKDNVKYLGSLSHDKLNNILSCADVILIPPPMNNYFDKAMHMKSGYSLKSCRPVITTRLRGISEYVSMLGLDNNVIYIEEWNFENLKNALKKAENLNIDPEKTIEQMKELAWEPRFTKLVNILLYNEKTQINQMEWI